VALVFLFPPSLGHAKATARAEVLARSLAEVVGEEVQVEVSRDYTELEIRALAGDADVVWAPSGVCARIEPSARGVYKVVRGASATYRSALVARAGCNVALSAMQGLRAAWVDPRSVGGYLLVREHLLARGIDPDATFASQAFVGSHPAVIAALLHGDADVGAVTVPRLDEASARDAIAPFVGAVAASRVTFLTISDEAPTDALVLMRRLGATRARELAAVLAPSGMDLRPPGALLTVMQADTLVPARPGEYKRVLALLREVGTPAAHFPRREM
jgi:phosphonate transport system substrate-binding protein